MQYGVDIILTELKKIVNDLPKVFEVNTSQTMN